MSINNTEKIERNLIDYCLVLLTHITREQNFKYLKHQIPKYHERAISSLEEVIRLSNELLGDIFS